MSQASVLTRIPPLSPPTSSREHLITEFLQVTPLLLYIIKKTNTNNLDTQTYCLYGEPYSISANHVEIRAGRIGIEINEDVHQGLAFVIGYVSNASGIELFQPNLSCVVKKDEIETNCVKHLEKRLSRHNRISLNIEKKRKGFVELSDLVINLGWDTLSRAAKLEM